jgi:hypothetical protein
VGVENPRHEVWSILVFRKSHDHEASCSHILNVMPKVHGFLNRPSQSNQRSLELREEAMFGSTRIEAMQVLLSVKNIDVFSVNPRLNQCFNR